MKKTVKNWSDRLTLEFESLKPTERLRELILYIAEVCSDDKRFGLTKLNKILFFSDFLYFVETGRSITGSAYRKDEFGPVPKNIEKLRHEMESKREIAMRFLRHGGLRQTKLAPTRKADLSLFTAEEIAQVDSVIKDLGGMTAATISDLSHKRAWRIARQDDLIPYEAALISDDPLTDYEINRTKELAEKHGWEN